MGMMVWQEWARRVVVDRRHFIFKGGSMKITRKVWVNSLVAGAVTLGLAGLATSVGAQTYNATFYVAGMGGHFAKAEVTIDPSKSQPIMVNKLTKVDIGGRADHPTHDPRIDANDRGSMFWSTYKIDKATGKAHVGKTDLATGNVVMDIDVDLPEGLKDDKSLFCGSAQSWDSYLPIAMTSPGFIDVYNKSDLKRTQRIMLEGTDADIGKPYKFYHGVGSPDMSKLLITVNEADKDHGKPIGKLHLVELDMQEFVKGNVKVLNKGLVPGAEGKTISFRTYYSHAGDKIAIGAADRVSIVDAKTLNVLDAEMMGDLEQTHDAIFTPDDRYVIATSRTKQPGPECEDPLKPKDGEFTMDGQLKLYDVQAQKFVGEATSVCLACHTEEGVEEHAILCGLDANWSDI